MARSLRDTIEALRRSVSAVIDRSALPETAPEIDENRRHGFRIGQVPLLHELTRDVELIELMPAYPLPNTAHWCLGLVNLRGRLIPVYDLNPLLGRAQPAPTGAKLLISGAGELATGLVIDDTPTAIIVEPSRRATVDWGGGVVPPVLREAVRAVYEIAGESWIDPDYDALFADLAARAVR